MARIACLGFCAADFLCENEGPAIGPFVGGTAANVAVILSHYGHSVAYVGMLGADDVGMSVKCDLERFGVDTRAALVSPAVKTPFCFEILVTKDGNYVSHTFETCSPDRTRVSPKYRAFDRDSWPASFERDQFDIVYVNKQDPAVFDLCGPGTFVFYEPDYIDDVDVHARIADMAHVLKFSHVQFIDCGIDVADRARGLVVETFGARGATYRLAPEAKRTHLQPGSAPIIDATGAGDWFSAALLTSLAEHWQNGNWLPPSDAINRGVRDAMDAAKEASMHRSALGLLRDPKRVPAPASEQRAFTRRSSP